MGSDRRLCLRRLLLVALNLNVFVALAGLCGVLFGTPGGGLLGTAAFLLSFLVIATHSKGVAARAVKAEPDVRTFVGAMAAVGVVACALGIVVTFAVLRGDGSPDGADGLGAFASRPRYVLNNHGKRTEVSRFRYVVGDASFFLGWFGGVLLANGTAHAMVASSLRADAEASAHSS